MAPPHVLLFPFPMQSAVNCMLKLSELLCLSVTVVNTEHIQQTLLRDPNFLPRFNRYSNFRFHTISDGLPNDHPRSTKLFGELLEGFRTVTGPCFREMMISGCFSSKSDCPVTVIISDGTITFTLDVAQQIQIPLIYFEIVSPCALLTFLLLPKLIDSGEIPFYGKDMDVLIKSVPGTETFLRRRDLPSFYRCRNLDNPTINMILKEASYVPRAYGVIINTFEVLDATILVHLRDICPNIYSLGPLHTLLKSCDTIQPKPTTDQIPQANVSLSLLEENRACLSWLDTQPEKSVVYVSFGSMVTMTVKQLFEIWHGLVNSGKPFLWVRRPGSIIGAYDESQVPKYLAGETKQRGFIAAWVPQEEVLAHSAIGGFLTHSGWNSTMESIVEGVPMICWPKDVDQQVNSRLVSEVWKVGIDIKDTCDRVIIEKAVNDLIHVRRDELFLSTKKFQEAAVQSVQKDGSSYMDLTRLVDDIKSMGSNY